MLNRKFVAFVCVCGFCDEIQEDRPGGTFWKEVQGNAKYSHPCDWNRINT